MEPKVLLRRLVLIGTPLALAVLEVFHPQPSGVTEAKVSRWAVGVFAVFFSAYDAAAGIATGFVCGRGRGSRLRGNGPFTRLPSTCPD